jgi:hypothetical protein
MHMGNVTIVIFFCMHAQILSYLIGNVRANSLICSCSWESVSSLIAAQSIPRSVHRWKTVRFRHHLKRCIIASQINPLIILVWSSTQSLFLPNLSHIIWKSIQMDLSKRKQRKHTKEMVDQNLATVLNCKLCHSTSDNILQTPRHYRPRYLPLAVNRVWFIFFFSRRVI